MYRLIAIALLALIGGVVQAAAKPVAFEFGVSPTAQDPFAREVWGEVVLPSGRLVYVPAFFAGKNHYAVRVRADAIGEYRLGKITETIGSLTKELAADVVGPSRKSIRTVNSRPAVALDPADPQRFVLSSGERFVPLGANLAWPDGRGTKFYRSAFDAFSHQGLNWTRVWMASWSGLNLDWLPEKLGPSPRRGALDLQVAESWDKIFEAAEENGIYIQVVLQHHGQYSTQVNSNWKDNPWNVANGGFLETPVDFFISPEAIRLTKQKYRYIVARWGYSPAVMSWELFNEVHWTDAMRGESKNEEAVARWHSLMAAYLRSLDRRGHLVSTSTEDLHSPIYADLDYFQPHLYAPNMLAAPRCFGVAPDELPKPVFYGEVGDDNMPVSDEVKKSGSPIVPPVWASLMGSGIFPAQAWLGRELMETGRLTELGAVARFLAATGWQRKSGLEPCTAVVECKERVPLVLVGGLRWERSPSIEMTLPLDGREPIGFAKIPRIYMNAAESPKNGNPSGATYRVNLAQSVTVLFHLVDSSAAASKFRFSVDGVTVSEVAWADLPKDSSIKGPRPQSDIVASVPAGEHTLVVENPGDTGWFDLAGIDFGMEQPVLAAIGQRNADFVAFWLWNRRSVFATKSAIAVSGSLVLDDLPAGSWRVTWWDTLNGKAAAPVSISHTGGLLRLPTPPIARHAAVVIERAGK